MQEPLVTSQLGKGLVTLLCNLGGFLVADAGTYQHSVRARENQSPPEMTLLTGSFPEGRGLRRDFSAQASRIYQHFKYVTFRGTWEYHKIRLMLYFLL